MVPRMRISGIVMVAGTMGVLASDALAGGAASAVVVKPPAKAHCHSDDAVVAIHLVAKGAWLGTSGGARCFVPDIAAGAVDATALDVELATLAPCTKTLELAAGAGVSYQDMVTVMDRAAFAGMRDVGVSSIKDLVVAFDDSAAARKKAPAHCTPTPPPAASATPATAAKPAKPAAPFKPPSKVFIDALGKPDAKGSADAAPSDLAGVPVIVVSKTEISVGDQKLGTIKKLAAGKGGGPIAPLVKALTTLPSSDAVNAGIVVVQAEAATDGAVIGRVIESTKDAGFDNLMFAIKTK